MNGAPTTCEAFEIAIERRAYGDLAEDESVELDGHLSSCASCPSYALSLDETRHELVAVAEQACAEIDWKNVERRLRSELGRRIRRRIASMATAPVAVGIALYGFGTDGERLQLALLLIGVVTPIVTVRFVTELLRFRRLARLTQRVDVFAEHRAELTRRIRSLETWRWAAIAHVLVFASLACLGWPEIAVKPRLVFAALATIVAGAWAETLAIELPRLRRQLAELDASMRG
jgi:hypothetical protein